MCIQKIKLRYQSSQVTFKEKSNLTGPQHFRGCSEISVPDSDGFFKTLYQLCESAPCLLQDLRKYGCSFLIHVYLLPKNQTHIKIYSGYIKHYRLLESH